MVVVGLVLIAATVLKIHQLLTEPIISKGFWESWEFFLIQIPLELGLGVWLISGLFKKAGWLTAVIAFAGFTVVTLQKGLRPIAPAAAVALGQTLLGRCNTDCYIFGRHRADFNIQQTTR